MNKYNIIYLSTYIDENISKNINLPYTSAGLKKKQEFIDMCSNHNLKIIFVSSFSRFIHIFVTSFQRKVHNNVKLIVPFFTKLVGLNYIINPITTFMAMYKENKKKKIDFIILYNCVYENVIPAFIFHKIFNTKVIVQYEDGWVISEKGFKGILYKIAHHLANHISSAVILNSTSFLKIFKKEKYFIFRGHIVKNIEKTVLPKKSHKLNILFASSIDTIRGINLLIKLFTLVTDIDFINKFNFIITGKGDDKIIKKLQTSIEIYSKNGGCANYNGFISRDKLKELYNQSDILLALQNPSLEFSKYCFPSKIFEYYQNNKPIITTNISDLSTVDFFNLEFIDYNIQSLIHKLNIIYNNYDVYQENNLMNSSRLFNKYSLENNTLKFNNFLEKLNV